MDALVELGMEDGILSPRAICTASVNVGIAVTPCAWDWAREGCQVDVGLSVVGAMTHGRRNEAFAVEVSAQHCTLEARRSIAVRLFL